MSIYKNKSPLIYEIFLAQVISLFVAIALPSVGISLYFYTSPNSDEAVSASSINSLNAELKAIEVKPKFSYSRARKLLWKHFLDSYSNPVVVQWSLWWSLAMAGFLMVQFYVQFLWQVVDENREHLLNAGVEAVLTLFGAISAFFAGYVSSRIFKKYDLWILTACSFLQGVMIIISSVTSNILVAYSMYILFGILFTFMITIATAFVAKELLDDSFALIFGINQLVALIFQTILTVVIMTWLNLDIRLQFFIFGSYFVTLSALFLIAAIVRAILHRNN